MAFRLTLLYIIATTPRWFLYSPSQITRGAVICFIASLTLLWIGECLEARQQAH